jgi:hypothetical protein
MYCLTDVMGIREPHAHRQRLLWRRQARFGPLGVKTFSLRLDIGPVSCAFPRFAHPNPCQLDESFFSLK